MFSDSSSHIEDSILLCIVPESCSVTLRIRTCTNGFMMDRQKDGDALHLVMRVGDLQEIIVKTCLGKEFPVSVERFKKHVEKKSGRDEDQEVLCDGLELADQQIINDMYSYEGAVVHFIVGESVEVRTNKLVENILELSITGPNTKKRKRNDDFRGAKGCKKEADVDHSPVQPVEPVKCDSVQLLEPLIMNPEVQLSEAVKDMIRQTLDGLENGSSPLQT